MKKWAMIVFTLLASFQFNTGWADETQDHEALRNLRREATNALNTNKFDVIAPLLDKTFTLITVDNHKFTNLQDFESYWNDLLHGKGAVLKSIQVDPSADTLTNFITPDVGVVAGTSNDTYNFMDGDTRRMPTRWTAVVKRNPDGWHIVSLHFSANLMDNPVLSAAKTLGYWYGVLGVFIGFIVGVIFMLFFRNKATV